MHDAIVRRAMVVVCAGLAWALALGTANAADEAEAIVLKADSGEGVTLVGKATVKPVRGKPEDQAAAGMLGERVANLGLWSKLVTEPSSIALAPTLPKAGYYDVYVRWYTGGFAGGASKALPIRIEHADGAMTITLTQQMGNVWAFMGTYPFKAGDAGRVVVDAQGTDGASNIHAVKFVPTGKPTTRPRVLPHDANTTDPLEKLRVDFAIAHTPNADAAVGDAVLAQKIAQEDAEAYFWWKTLQRGEGVTELWTTPSVGRDLSKNEGGGWPLRTQYERIEAMARAYVGSNGPLGFAAKMQGNPELLKDILYALEFFYEYRYNERTKNKMGADWIGNEITQPLLIATTINLIYPHVSRGFIDKQVATFNHMAPTPLRMYGGVGPTTGFNRFYACYAWAMRGLMANDAEMIAAARDGIGEEFQINDRANPISRGGKVSADGFYEDGSFIQHGAFPYIGIYGRGVLEMYGKLKDLLKDSPWAVNDPRAQIFNRWVLEGYAPLFFNGDIMYGSLGRSTGQSWHQNGTVSSEIINAIAPLVPLAESADAKAQLAGVLRAWLLDKDRAAFPQFNRLDLGRVDIPSYILLQQIKNDTSIEPLRPKPGTYVFHNSDYVVHHQPDFAVQLRMFSTRTKTHENLHQGTNMKGWYQGEGTLFIYNRDNSRYQDHFWATVNPYRLPGTTVDTRSREADLVNDGNYSQSAWAGGVQLDGLGLASMGLKALDSTLTAHKAWFFLGDQIVCLGSAINSSDNRAIETIIENVKLHGQGDNQLTVNATPQPATLGESSTLEAVSWAHLAGPVPGSDTGWVFPQPATLQSLRESRSGSWTESFKKDKDAATHSRTYFTLWQDHGSNPKDAGYAYIVLPGRTAEQVRAYATQPAVKLLANTPQVQAVEASAMGVLAANFWQAGEAGRLRSTGPAAVLVHQHADRLSLAVSDPAQATTDSSHAGGSIEIELADAVTRLIEADPAVRVLTLNPLRVRVELAGTYGRSLVSRFER